MNATGSHRKIVSRPDGMPAARRSFRVVGFLRAIGPQDGRGIASTHRGTQCGILRFGPPFTFG
jgi:hypothetical protein